MFLFRYSERLEELLDGLEEEDIVYFLIWKERIKAKTNK